MSLDAGTRLGSYEIVSSLGRGGMGEVYRAKDRKLGREVALKVLDPDLASDAERLRRFEQEARAASALNHPNIVHIYDVGDEDGTHYIAMELVEGKTLRQVLAEAPLSPTHLLELARQLADGLAKAHSAGIVHRDLKPENVMVTSDGFVKILDFGLAKLSGLPFELTSDMATLARTRHGVLIGTVEYMSPEQAAGRSVDYRSDQFSLGLILYEMATGKLAFHRDTAAQTLASIIESEPPPLRVVAPRLPQALDEVVERCLAKDPAERYDDTHELAKSLRALPKAPSEEVPPEPRVVPDPVEAGPLVLGGTIGRYVSHEVRGALAEVDRELRAAMGIRGYQIDTGRSLKHLSETRLRRRLRSNRYSGVEMIRRDGEEQWVPLHETQIFRDEVPYRGRSADWAAKRRLLGFANHLSVFVTVGVAMYFATGEVPFWMGFWGIGLVSHGVRALPAAMSLFGRKRLAAPAEKELGQGEEKLLEPPEELLSESFREEVSRVRDLLGRREGPEKDAMLQEIDGIVERMRAIASMRRDLEEQTSREECEALERTEREAERRVLATTSVRDRKLYERQREVVRQRRETIQKALLVLERLGVRQDVTEHQLKQLRLDLARAEASSANVPELSSRLQDIRHEVDAIDEVDEALARELTS